MMPGRRYSDDVGAFFAATGMLLIVFLMAWASVVFFAAASWALFVYFLRALGVA